MASTLLVLISRWWKFFTIVFVIFDLFLVAGLLLFFAAREAERVAAAEVARLNATPTPTATATATVTPWPGTPPKTYEPVMPPTPLATDVLAASGFPPGFTPTPRPTREPVMISLPLIAPVSASSVGVPVINQIHYPEPFFPAGTNNACGPVALYAALWALGANVNYGRLRDIAVHNGFTSSGISKQGMVNTIITLNNELGNPYVIEYGNHFATKDLMQKIRQGGIAIVLIRVRRANGRYYVTADRQNSIGHFLIVESINTRTRIVRFAGSTLGMDEVALPDFIQSWASNPQAVVRPSLSWQNYAKKEQAENWALFIKKR